MSEEEAPFVITKELQNRIAYSEKYDDGVSCCCERALLLCCDVAPHIAVKM